MIKSSNDITKKIYKNKKAANKPIMHFDIGTVSLGVIPGGGSYLFYSTRGDGDEANVILRVL